MKSGLSTNAVQRISTVLMEIIDDFPAQRFNNAALEGLEDLELKQRVDHLISVLAQHLPTDFLQTADILLQIKQHWDWGEESDALSGFAAWPLIDYVAVYGLEQPEIALKVLKELTPLFSAEFAIRPFIEHHFELTHRTMLSWCNDPDEHVRRLASEGIRPRLPWGKRLIKFCDEPAEIVEILELLKDDPSLYVRKSVANNLNDISKDNPDRLVALCHKWSLNAPVERQWIICHGLRSLVKEGREDVFPLLGYTADPQIKVNHFKLKEDTITLGKQLDFEIDLLSLVPSKQKLVVDYKVYHQKANGSMTSKVFKWKNISLQAGQQMSLVKAHPFKQITTRKYYSGEHVIELLINGKAYGKISFELVL